jgi:hypothetical protein
MSSTLKFGHHKYIWTKPFDSVRHHWEFVGPHGGIHFHVSVSKEYGDSCGLEFHHSEPVGYFKNTAFHHKDCAVIGGNCWHDGTSLYASETLWPWISSCLKAGDHEEIFRILEQEFIRHFSKFYPELTQSNSEEEDAA